MLTDAGDADAKARIYAAVRSLADDVSAASTTLGVALGAISEPVTVNVVLPAVPPQPIRHPTLPPASPLPATTSAIVPAGGNDTEADAGARSHATAVLAALLGATGLAFAVAVAARSRRACQAHTTRGSDVRSRTSPFAIARVTKSNNAEEGNAPAGSFPSAAPAATPPLAPSSHLFDYAPPVAAVVAAPSVDALSSTPSITVTGELVAPRPPSMQDVGADGPQRAYARTLERARQGIRQNTRQGTRLPPPAPLPAPAAGVAHGPQEQQSLPSWQTSVELSTPMAPRHPSPDVADPDVSGAASHV